MWNIIQKEKILPIFVQSERLTANILMCLPSSLIWNVYDWADSIYIVLYADFLMLTILRIFSPIFLQT